MVEVIVLSDDEEESNHVVKSTHVSEQREGNLSDGNGVKLDKKRPYKLVLVDSRRCPRMPRPRILPITFASEVSPQILPDHNDQTMASSDRKNLCTLTERARSAEEMDDDDEDPDYEDLRPLKRRRTAMKKVPKQHGKLSAPDWEVVKNGAAGVRHPGDRPLLRDRAMADRKEARDYVKKLTANIDWEDILRHLEMLRLKEAKSGPGDMDQPKTSCKTRRVPSQANRLKQYWQTVLTKSMLNMDVDCSK